MDLHEQYRILGEDWARQDGVAGGLEDMTKVILSELVNNSSHSTLGRAEHDARGSLKYKNHLIQAREARTKANILRAHYKALDMKFEFWRSSNATKRAEMRL